MQLIISAAMIEQCESVLQRHFGYNRSGTLEAAWLLHDIAKEGPLPLSTLVVVGSGFVPFASGLEAEIAAKGTASRTDGIVVGRIFEILVPEVYFICLEMRVVALSESRSDDEFNVTLAETVSSIYEASIS